MLQTIEAIYHEGIVELKEKPLGVKKSRALVILLDSEEPKESLLIDWEKVKNSRSSVEKWIGILEGIDIRDWKTLKRDHLEGKHQ